MKLLKKLLILVVSVVVAAALTACGGAQNGDSQTAGTASPASSSSTYDKDAAVEKAESIIDSINARDYQPVYDVMTAVMQQALPVDKMKEGFDPVLDASGAFVKYTGAETTAAAQDGVDYIVVVVSAKYEKATRVYTISLTAEDMKLGGLFMK